MGTTRSLLSSCGLSGIVFILIFQRASSVIVYNISLITEKNRTDYVLQGESASLFCNYATAPDETVSSVRWEWKTRGSEESTEVYVWRPGRRPVAKEIFFGRTDTTNLEPNVVVIRQSHIVMEGKYTCLVQTNQMTAHTEFMLIVIVDACHENVWQTSLDMDACTETISMNCVGLFPKPSPSCGVFNEATGSYMTSVPFDRVVTLRNGTYEVTLNRFYKISDWKHYNNITFACYFVIDGTSWRRGIRHRLFGAFGCSAQPPSPGPGSYNMSEEKSCWGNPRENATVRYTCNAKKRLIGPETLVCRNGVWSPEQLTIDGPIKPFCNGGKSVEFLSSVVSLISTIFALQANIRRL